MVHMVRTPSGLSGKCLAQLTHLPDHYVRCLRRRPVPPYSHVRRHVDKAPLVAVSRGTEKVTVASQFRVRRDPVDMHGTPGEECCGDLRLRPKGDLLGDSRLFAMRGFGSPCLRQLELVEQQDAACCSHPEKKNAQLPAFLLAQPSAPRRCTPALSVSRLMNRDPLNTRVLPIVDPAAVPTCSSLNTVQLFQCATRMCRLHTSSILSPYIHLICTPVLVPRIGQRVTDWRESGRS